MLLTVEEMLTYFWQRLIMCFHSGGQCERIQVACSSQQDLQDWLDLLTKHTHSTPTHLYKPQNACHTVSL